MSRITEGPIVKTVLRLAWPVIAAEGLHTAFQVVDVAWVGNLGKDATAAVTTSMFAVWIIFALSELVNTGVMAYVSRSIGMKDDARAREVATQGLNLALILGLVVAVFGSLAAGPLFRLLAVDPEVARLGGKYLRIVAWTSPASFLYLGGANVLRARGDTRRPLLVTLGGVLLNATIDPLFIYGLKLGIEGAAIATAICQSLAVVAFAYLVPLDRRRVLRFDWKLVGNLAKTGAPYCLMIVGFSGVYLWFTHLVTPFGAAAVAVVGLSNRMESLCYLPADGFRVASATMVGQNLGAGKPARAVRAAWTGVGMISILAAVLSTVFALFPAQLFHFFTNDPRIIELGVPYLRVIAMCQISSGIEGAISGGFAGAGDTTPPMIIHGTFAVLRLPLAVLAVHRLGLDGIAWTISGTCIVRSVILVGWFLRGKWTTRKLDGLSEDSPLAA
jgi:putative MATE family efflux protein